MSDYKFTNDELQHHGILGMKWGIRRYQNDDGSLTAMGKIRYGYQKHRQKLTDRRKSKVLQSERSKKVNVESARKEAADRIKFYGGKAVARREIEKERNYAVKKTALKRGAIGSLAATGGFLAAASEGASFVASLGVGVLPVAAVTAASIAIGTKYIREHAAEQIAYTADSNAKGDPIDDKYLK